MEIAAKLEVDLLYRQLLRKIKEALGQNSDSWGLQFESGTSGPYT
jgi:hypothetical protein